MTLKAIWTAAAVVGLIAGCAAATVGDGKTPSGSPNLTSNLQVEAGKEFLFGGGMNGAYTIDAKNEGSVALRIAALAGDKRTEIVELQPGERAVHKFADGEIAVVMNTSPKVNGRATLRVWGKVNVGMRYQDAK